MNIHATCIDISGKGVLLLGESGSGKSDLALRLIASFKAKLIADDRVNILIKKGQVIASAPKNLKDLLEIRGIGIIKLPSVKKTKLKLAVDLSKRPQERLPEESFYEIDGTKIPFICLNPFEASAPAKILAALSLL